MGHASGREVELDRCDACGTAHIAAGETPPAQELYETGAYAPGSGARDRVLEPLRRIIDRDRVRLLGPVPVDGRVIEIGAGRGRMVAALRAGGHDAVGIEPSLSSSTAAASRGLPVERALIEDAAFPAAAASMVVFWHVLEHLDDPAAALGRAREWLEPGGRLVVAVPNLGSLQARIGGDRWFHQDVPRHRTQFTVAGVEELMRRCGFEPTASRQVMIDQAPLGMWLTLLNFLTAGRDVPLRFLKRDLRYGRREQAARDGAVSVLAGIPLLPVAALLELVAGSAGRGGAVVVNATRA